MSLIGEHVIHEYVYKNKDLIPIVNVVRVTKEVATRLDIIINRYCGGKFEYLPILMDFNKITNPFAIQVGTMLNIPDFGFITNNLEFQKIQEAESIPGINESMESKVVNENREIINSSSDGDMSGTSVAIPKLKVKLRKVSYDSQTGIIKY